MSINWLNIRDLGNSKNDAFEELVSQLARKESPPLSSRFIRVGKPDGGLECYWIFNNDDEWGWQAKFFTASLDDSQWKQIDKSVKTVLGTHPKLTRYYIAIPIDPPDARIEGQKSMQDKWDEHVQKWTEWATEKNMNVEFMAWWSSTLIEKLADAKNVGLTYFWFHKEEFTDQWISRFNDLSITDLGRRYTPENNVRLEILELFHGLSRNRSFVEKFQERYKHLQATGDDISIEEEVIKSRAIEIKNNTDELCEACRQFVFNGISELLCEDFLLRIKSIRELKASIREFYLAEEEKIPRTKENYSRYQKYNHQISELNELEDSLDEFERLLSSEQVSLVNNPYLVISGDAGIGKSHLMADAVSLRQSDDGMSLFLLGQHLVTQEDLWVQILKKLGLKCSVDEFLGALESRAQVSGKRLVIFIDAINEGQGRVVWKRDVFSFIKRLKEYKWLGLVLSVRSSYKELIFPASQLLTTEVTYARHFGFRYKEHEATKLFFKNYEIEYPSIPMLYPEFQNPLFLRFFCEGIRRLGHKKIPDGVHGISAVIKFYTEGINRTLASADRFNYSEKINLVLKVVESLLVEKERSEKKYIEFERACILATETVSSFTTNKNFLMELISEGVISQNLFWKEGDEYEDGVYITYERFEDYFTANFLVQKVLDKEKSSIAKIIKKYFPKYYITKAAKNGGVLYKVLKDENSVSLNQGIAEALSVQLPEVFGVELYEICPEIRNSYPIAESFVSSLAWRKHQTLGPHLESYIRGCVLTYRGTFNLYWDTIISLAAAPDNYFNGEWLHKILFPQSLANRDARWTIHLKNQMSEESSFKKLIDWCLEESNKSHFSNDSVMLAGLTVSWFLTSTNRKFRDYSTKALLVLFQERVHLLVKLLKKFENVNDPYIYERLFAVSYGCSIRTSQKDEVKFLGLYVYETIFCKEEVYPHILLRDYARGIIEVAQSYQDLNIDLQIIVPPYKSHLIETYPAFDEIYNKYMLDYNSSDFKPYKWGQNSIISSMLTEHGKKGGYGDFGRYVFQSAFRSWFKNVEPISSYAIEMIFEKYGYDVELHGEFDRSIGSGRGRNEKYIERIGKKYQWLAFYELLARVSDNLKKYKDFSFNKEEFEPYQGPWNPYVRDIDPTMTIISEPKKKDLKEKHFWESDHEVSFYEEDKKWLTIDDDLPDALKLIELKDKLGEDWLLLEGYPEWKSKERKKENGRKNVWYQYRSYFVHEDEFDKVRGWMESQDFMGRWMPESHSTYQVFSREYCSSSAYKEIYAEDPWSTITDSDSSEVIGKVLPTTNNFLWEEEFDYSKSRSISMLKPCSLLFKQMDLRYNEKEGELINSTKELVCFDPSVALDTMSCLLIRKKSLLKFLEENKLKIVWSLIGEKNVLNSEVTRAEDFPGWLEISGAFCLRDGEVIGKTKTKK